MSVSEEYGFGRELLLGVGGGISAYKSCDLLRRLQDCGFLVTVLPTRSSLNFVGKATWEALSGREVHTDLWSNIYQVPHIALAKKIDAMVVAPATADLIAKIAHGIADDLLTNVLLASDKPLVVVPAMHPAMWLNAATVANVSLLRSRGHLVIEPEIGRMTGDDFGPGRYPEVGGVVSKIQEYLNANSDLSGKKILVTAGGTREKIDPVRYLGNRSSGKQGLAICLQAIKRGASVTLIAANIEPSLLTPLDGVTIIGVESTQDMREALAQHVPHCDVLFMGAAIADFKSAEYSETKMEKVDSQTIALERNPDLLAELGAGKKENQIFIAFAAQGDIHNPTELLKAQKKLIAKKADYLYLNNVIQKDIFGSEDTEGLILAADGVKNEVLRTSKMTLAAKLLDLALDKLG